MAWFRSFCRGLGAACLLAAGMGPGLHPASAVTIDMVTVGNPGNANDPAGGLYGSVASPFRIGKYEVTIGQYTAFLNAVAATDTNSLYNTSMASDLNSAGIARSGTSGSFTYSVIGPSGTTPAGASSPANRPITYVSWFDAARFANWMSNGQPTGSQSATTTENGAYNLAGSSSSGEAPTVNAINPNTGDVPTFALPTENQWYKAAYYSAALNSGAGGYYSYATQSNTAPGNLIGTGTNQANYFTGYTDPPGTWSVTQLPLESISGDQNYLTDVGAFTNSSSYYGTFDQSGNVLEWNDLSGGANFYRGLRGGGWADFNTQFDVSSATRFDVLASYEGDDVVGFRLVSPVPEPASLGLAFGGVLCFGGWRLLKRRQRTCRSRLSTAARRVA